MTLEELAESSASQLEAMSDAQLLEHFQKYLSVTRPELATKPTATKKNEAPVPTMSAQQRLALEQLAAEGVDLSFMKMRRRK